MFTLHNLYLFGICFGLVYTGLGLIGVVLVLLASTMSDKSFRDTLLDGLETLNLPFPIIAAFYFGCIIWGWPFILAFIERKRKETEEEKNK